MNKNHRAKETSNDKQFRVRIELLEHTLRIKGLTPGERKDVLEARIQALERTNYFSGVAANRMDSLEKQYEWLDASIRAFVKRIEDCEQRMNLIEARLPTGQRNYSDVKAGSPEQMLAELYRQEEAAPNIPSEPLMRRFWKRLFS
jgi:DNA-binding transcriptional regulator YbjK